MNRIKSKILVISALSILVTTACTMALAPTIEIESPTTEMETNTITEMKDTPTIIVEMNDVSPRDWFYRYVVAGLRFGVIRNENYEYMYFEPDRDVTVGEFISMLGRLHEYGHGVISMPNNGEFCERYLEWALEIGIVHEYKHWDLMPGDVITREQKAMIVWQYIELFDLLYYLQHEYPVTMTLFWDYSEMSYWAQGPIEVLRTCLLMHGRYMGYFKPHDSVNRAEALRIIIRIGSAIYDFIHPLVR